MRETFIAKFYELQRLTNLQTKTSIYTSSYKLERGAKAREKL